MKEAGIIIIDDNRSILSALMLMLKFQCRFVNGFAGPDQAFNAFQRNNYDVVLLDMNFKAGVNTGNEGLFWLEKFHKVNPEVSIVMMTAYGDIGLAVTAIKKGAVDFVLKPWENEKLLATLQSAINLTRSRREVSALKSKEKELIGVLNRDTRNIVGDSPAIKAVLAMVEKVAATDANVLITGENGTGKELIAREIHRLSPRNNQLLVTVDMGAISETLFESELFGHKKGAFTDAIADRPGKFEMANYGTLFLDEIGNLPVTMQAKLLTVLQNRTITRVGENAPNTIDIRLISATNCDIEKRVEEGSFREDLLYRLNTINIEVPPLRERTGDVAQLSRFFMEKYGSKYHKPGLQISRAALQKLEDYDWPGNIRELQHTIEKAVILAGSTQLGIHDFNLRNNVRTPAITAKVTIGEMELQMIEAALIRHNGNLSAAASELGITRQTLYNKMKRHDV